MSDYHGVVELDAADRERHRSLTHVLWQRLAEDGVHPGQPGRIDAMLIAPSEAAAALLVDRFRTTAGDWESDIQPTSDGSGRLAVWIRSPEVGLTLDAFLELADVMLVAAQRAGCVFDGFELEQRVPVSPPWWKAWWVKRWGRPTRA